MRQTALGMAAQKVFSLHCMRCAWITCRGCCGCGGMQEGEPASGGVTYGNNMLKGPDITSHNCAGYMPRYIPSPQPSTFPQVDNGSRTLPASLSTR